MEITLRKVFLITGFQNWGKTHLIRAMFNGRSRFYYDSQYDYSGFKFCVQSQSNDDLGKKEFENKLKERLSSLSKVGMKPTHICAAFCPTKEPGNLSDEIISNLFQNDEVHVIAIEHKWCSQAKLHIGSVTRYYSHLSNVTVHSLSEKDAGKKKVALDKLLKPLL